MQPTEPYLTTRRDMREFRIHVQGIKLIEHESTDTEPGSEPGSDTPGAGPSGAVTGWLCLLALVLPLLLVMLLDDSPAVRSLREAANGVLGASLVPLALASGAAGLCVIGLGIVSYFRMIDSVGLAISNPPLSYRWDEQGLETIAPSHASFQPWGSFTRWYETPGLLVAFGEYEQSQLLSKQALSPEQADEIRSHLLRHVGEPEQGGPDAH